VLPDKTAPKQLRGFQKGQSGNPAGRAQCSRTKATLFAEAILENDREGIMDAVVNAAKNGDPTAMRLCVERLVPLRKGRPVVFDLPPVKTAADIAGAVGELARAMSAGELTTDEASAAASVIEMHRRAIETCDIEQRLRKVEEAQSK
jgi:Family of unknown function (DUF5681)